MSVADTGLPYEHPDRMVPVGQDLALDITIVNYGNWIKEVSLPFVLMFYKTGLILIHRYKHVLPLCNLTDSTIEEVNPSLHKRCYRSPNYFLFCRL